MTKKFCLMAIALLFLPALLCAAAAPDDEPGL
jgi:hypothetical protein